MEHDQPNERPTLPITGERTVPGIWHENYWLRRHEAVYVTVTSELDIGGRILDAGCGEGYGAALLAKGGAEVVAVDLDAATVEHVRRAYPRLVVVRANLVALPFADSTYDAVVSLQTIEHLWDQAGFVAECGRVLRPGGRLVVSTPNRLTFPPGNPYHATELSPAELHELLVQPGRLVSLRGLHHGPGLRTWEQRHGSIVEAQLAVPVDEWPAALAERARTVSVDDFVLTDNLDGCLDLVAVVVRDDDRTPTGG